MSFHARVLATALAAVACPPLLAPAEAPAQAPAPASETRTLQGRIGEKYRIQVRLRRDGARLTGDYFYESVGKPLRLEGTVDASGRFTLREFDPAGAPTGVFRGRWQPAWAELPIRGDWTRPDGTRAMRFHLADWPVAFTGGLRIVTRERRWENRPGRAAYEVTAEYPQVEGGGGPGVAAFNRAVRELVERQTAGMRREFEGPDGVGGEQHLDYHVELADDDLVSVHFTDYFFYEGAGQRNAVSRTLSYDLKRGRRIRWADLFVPGSGVERAVSAHALRELKRTHAGEAWATDERLGRSVEHVVGDEDRWLLGREGLVLVFDSAEIGPPGAAAGTVTVPYSALRRFARRDGPLARFVR